jgi:hypothetical protein
MNKSFFCCTLSKIKIDESLNIVDYNRVGGLDYSISHYIPSIYVSVRVLYRYRNRRIHA